MKRRKKTKSEFIIDALRTGEKMGTPDIVERVSKQSGKKIKIQDVASMLAKLSNSEKGDIGFLLQRKKVQKGYIYNLVPEALSFSPEKLYDLTRKTGKNRYTLAQAMEEQPDLKKYVHSAAQIIPQPGETTATTEQPEAAATAKQDRMPQACETEKSDQTIKNIYAGIMEKIFDQGELNVNVNLTLHLAGIGNK